MTTSSSSRLAFGLFFYVLLSLKTIDSQFIEASHDRAHVGDNVTLKCRLDDAALESNEFASYTWLLNNKKITIDSNSSKHFEQRGDALTIRNATRHLSGYYSCVVKFETSGAKLETPQELISFHPTVINADAAATNVDEKLHSSPCNFRIPKLCRNKRNKNNEEDIVSVLSKEGSSVSLECHLGDVNEQSSVKWMKDGSQVLLEHDDDARRRFKVETRKHFMLTILQVSSDDAGLYDCVQFGEQDQFKIKSARRYRLMVNEGFRFTTKPASSKNLEIGSSGKVHCKAIGSTRIHWVKDERDSLPSDVEDANGTLIFSHVRMDHKGAYNCIATNGADVIKTAVDVRILPVFNTTPPESLEIVEMQIVFLDCQAEGSPPPTIKWFRDGTEITSEGRYRIFPNGTLQLQEARQDDAGVYECVAGSSAGFKRAETSVIVKGMDAFKPYEDANQEASFIMSKAVLMTCLVALIYISLVIALMLWCRHRKNKSRANANGEDMEKRGEGENDDTASDGDENKPLNNEQIKSSRNNKVHQHKDKPKKLATSPSSTLIIDHLMIPYHCLNDLTKLGRGQFGEVLSGRATDVDLPHTSINSNGSSVKENGNAANGKSNDLNEIQAAQKMVDVLIKSMSRLKDESHFIEFRRQIDLYRAVDSQHVVKLLALSFEKDHHYMILEHYRDLKGYLMEQRDKAPLYQLVQFSLHVARGLDAIAKSKLTHRDIALRNCVISSNKLTIKLSSIALCKDKHSADYMRKDNAAGGGYRLFAFRHSAPEILLQQSGYTTTSDVYSCAIAIWEILNRGECAPFDGIDSEEFVQLMATQKLDYGKLFAIEKLHGNEQVKEVLLKCCSINPNDRPAPENLVKSLESIAAAVGNRDS